MFFWKPHDESKLLQHSLCHWVINKHTKSWNFFSRFLLKKTRPVHARNPAAQENLNPWFIIHRNFWTWIKYICLTPELLIKQHHNASSSHLISQNDFQRTSIHKKIQGEIIIGHQVDTGPRKQRLVVQQEQDEKLQRSILALKKTNWQEVYRVATPSEGNTTIQHWRNRYVPKE